MAMYIQICNIYICCTGDTSTLQTKAGGGFETAGQLFFFYCTAKEKVKGSQRIPAGVSYELYMLWLKINVIDLYLVFIHSFFFFL